MSGIAWAWAIAAHPKRSRTKQKYPAARYVRIPATSDEPEGGIVPDGVSAYILIQTAVHSENVARDIRSVDGVESADDVSGPYDVIVRATASDMDSLGQLVVARIQSVEGITRTLTCPIVQL
jgi:DNA-binding Lrp family transcriptional regulator